MDNNSLIKQDIFINIAVNSTQIRLLFEQVLQQQQRILALDVSKKHLGIAISDQYGRLALPKQVIIRNKLTKDVVIINQLIRDYFIGLFVIGYPIALDGDVNYRTQAIIDFCKALKKILVLELPIVLQDERFSTQAVILPMNKKVNQLQDDQSACWFLQTFLDQYNQQCTY